MVVIADTTFANYHKLLYALESTFNHEDYDLWSIGEGDGRFYIVRDSSVSTWWTAYGPGDVSLGHHDALPNAWRDILNRAIKHAVAHHWSQQ